MTLLSILFAFVVAYFIGSIPTAYLLLKLRGLNVFEIGSKNMGAMNVARNVSYPLGVFILFLDIVKGTVAAYLASFISYEAVLAASVGVILGHAWSVFVKFRGGKALATSFGAILVIDPMLGLYSFTALMLFSLIFLKRNNLAGIASCITFIVLIPILQLPWSTLLAAPLMAGIVALRHLLAIQNMAKVNLSNE